MKNILITPNTMLLKMQNDLENMLDKIHILKNNSYQCTDLFYLCSNKLINSINVLTNDKYVNTFNQINKNLYFIANLSKLTINIFFNEKRDDIIKEFKNIFKENANIKIPIIEKILYKTKAELQTISKYIQSNGIMNYNNIIDLKKLHLEFISFIQTSYLYEECNNLLFCYKNILNDIYPNYKPIDHNYIYNKASIFLYNNSNFFSIINDNLTLGALLILNNNDEINFLPEIIASYAINRNKELYDFLYYNKKNKYLENSNLIKIFNEYTNEINLYN
ncbi:hypothetical protein A9X84_09555 [Brachyspira hyodysenteriae]|uniref:hypothetical protein n=1 Tax=Brachyspira hyodysenteriae TaxID=159 RepID=UPI00063D9D57|nr:hypothetical protein [Brachyspira hyodysenteriae]AUJ48959.1 hypothetical protein BH718_00501 [Brachyspira hyodysenteriae]KLI51584.1 hypothetical protein SZ41_00615 [Brachyspira hyodysenteriae]KLI54812.1 hypothetical protein SZ43_02365 [Brachyspira hyodysenteriae]TVL43567.1 hypothetical protein A9X84_09555 [Brachyspira hyodysenteriae]TVL68336.1 hypothetical protein A9X75_08120 [Brachyspira hyodysenteriae]